MKPVLIGSEALEVLAAAARSTLGLRKSIVGDRRQWRGDSVELQRIETETAAIEKAIQLADEALGKKVVP
jgi:hypothetical protein